MRAPDPASPVTGQPRSSASVDRVASLLTYLAARPGESFSIAELGRRLDISKATCHALVMSLSEWGFVLRSPVDKQIRLGPALVSLGVQAAALHAQLVDFAAEEMRFLAARYDAQCGATVAMGDDIVVLATHGTPAGRDTALQTGQRLPLRPPFGGVHVAWAPVADQARWLANHGAEGTFDAAAYERVFEVIRERGFSIALELDPRTQVSRALQGFSGDETLDSVGAALTGVLDTLEFEEYYVVRIDEDAEYRIRHLAAPVFDAAGRVPFVITLVGLGRAVTGAAINAMAKDVLDATAKVSRMISRAGIART
jgi:DNA-binding IclR family transcriptional regulator